ncbi:MAG: C40 family peptidase [Desulfobaccales bacterium]
MAKRIIVSMVVTLALTFSPSLAFSLPTKTVKKKTSSSNTQREDSRKSKSAKKSNYSSRHSRRDSGEVVESSMVPQAGASVHETAPLMKVTPQRDGGFLIEPLEPKKNGATLSKPSSNMEVDRDQGSLRQGHQYNRFEPWDFSDLILAQAKYYRDTPYARGGSLQTGNATDCSGFVQYIYKGFKINLPRSSAEQAQVGKVVTQDMDFSKLLPGDLLFFRRGGRVGHAGIYLGGGKMIHASNYRNGVTVTDLRQPYYEGTFVVARRVFEVQYPKY